MKKIILIFIISLSCFSNVFSQAIPTPGFESWDTVPLPPQPTIYYEPVGWTSNNSGYPTYPITVSPSTNRCSGAYSLQIQTMQYVNSVTSNFDTLEGLAVSGADLLGGHYGFRDTVRCTHMTACVKYIPSGNDSAELSVQFTKWNQASQMSSVVTTNFCYKRIGATPNFTTITVPIYFINGTVIPDTAIISLASSSANTIAMPGSTLIVDDLLFSNGVGITPVYRDNTTVTVYPNPARDEISFSFLPADAKLLRLFDITGKEVAHYAVTGSEILLSVKDFNEGMYIYEVSGESNKTLATGKISVVK